MILDVVYMTASVKSPIIAHSANSSVKTCKNIPSSIKYQFNGQIFIKIGHIIYVRIGNFVTNPNLNLVLTHHEVFGRNRPSKRSTLTIICFETVPDANPCFNVCLLYHVTSRMSDTFVFAFGKVYKDRNLTTFES